MPPNLNVRVNSRRLSDARAHSIPRPQNIFDCFSCRFTLAAVGLCARKTAQPREFPRPDAVTNQLCRKFEMISLRIGASAAIEASSALGIIRVGNRRGRHVKTHACRRTVFRNDRVEPAARVSARGRLGLARMEIRIDDGRRPSPAFFDPSLIALALI
jgi:hypothetical protein